MDKNFRTLMAEAKFFEGYARFDDNLGRYETWEEAVTRVMNMHRDYYSNLMTPELKDYIDFAERMYKDKKVLGAQRALQFGGDQLLKNHARLYNCAATYADRPEFFGECFHLMLCGCGVGFSVQRPHVASMPEIRRRDKDPKTFVVPDSIEGWARALDVLMSSFFTSGVHQEYEGHKVYFDLEQIRPKGAHISGGFKAPGPEPLRKALDRIEQMLKDILKSGRTTLKPIDIYDITMHAADAVISGGVRRAATICLFSLDDKEMMRAKTGNWFNDNPQRARSNNSVVLLRDETSYTELKAIVDSIKECGEPGFVFSDDIDTLFNPCCEIGLYPRLESGNTGVQMCNLTEINGGLSNTKEEFFEQCQAAAILGTLQAGYTNFKFLNEESHKLIEEEALIGVGITGWMNNPDILFDKNNMVGGAEIVKATNKVLAEILRINPAARCTTVKPSGNSSVLLETTSGIHGEHAPAYIRNVQFNKETEIAKIFEKLNPDMVSDSVWSQNGTDICVSFPVISPKGSKYKSELLGVKQLEYVKRAQQYWIEYGTDIDLCRKPYLRHNVSNTITVDDWDEVIDYVYDNRDYLCGVSFLSEFGDKALPQAPFTEVLNLQQLTDKYGAEVLLTSALIEAGLHAFNDDLWLACDTALGRGKDISKETHSNIPKRDFVRRFEKFAKNFSTKEECAECLKDVYLFHRWWKIQKNARFINFVEELEEKTYTDINTMGAQACAGGACEWGS
jgi:ribonucleoside-diphosphate reductase alpha chain